MRVAVVGYGYWGAKHLRVLTAIPGVTTAIVDRNPCRLAEAKRGFPRTRAVADLAEVADRVDAVVVATPPRTHAALVMLAIQHGLHVLVEKPLAMSVVECEQLIAAAHSAGTTLMVGHTFEHNPAVWKLREIVQSGQLGDIRYIDSARLSLGLYQSEVNVIWDLAPHDVSIVNFLFGRLPTLVSAWGHSHAGSAAEDVAHLKLSYSDPPMTAYIHVSWLDPCKVRRVTVVGRDKMVVYNDIAASEPIRVYDASVSPIELTDPDAGHAPMSYRLGDIVSPYVAMQEPLLVEDTHFIDCIRTGATPRTDGNSGLAVVQVLETADAALAEGLAIPLNGHRPPVATALGMAG